MASLSTVSLADSIATPNKTGRPKVDFALAKISNAWKGNSLDAARTAAFELGKLTAGGMLRISQGRRILEAQVYCSTSRREMVVNGTRSFSKWPFVARNDE